jgi:hypothetical protein
MEFISGLTVDLMKEPGSKISFMAKVNILGQMVAAMKVNIVMTKSMGLVFTHIQMALNTRANGLTASSTVRASL